MTRPLWMSYALYSPFADASRARFTKIPKSWLVYVEAEDRAYCRLNALTFSGRVKPEVPERGPHPRSACRSL